MAEKLHRNKKLIILAKARTKEGAMMMLNNIILRTGCSSLEILKVLVNRIKNFK